MNQVVKTTNVISDMAKAKIAGAGSHGLPDRGPGKFDELDAVTGTANVGDHDLRALNTRDALDDLRGTGRFRGDLETEDLLKEC